MALLIHAGIHRTGTTSLQRFLAANRGELARRGVVYPGRGKSHQKLAWALKRGEAGAEAVLALMETAPRAHTVILSGEDFSVHTDLGWLAAVARHHQVQAVFYLRRQDHWLMSWYNQHVKWPFAQVKSQMDPQAFLTTLHQFHWLDYAKLVERWSAVLGPEQVMVAVTEPGQVEDVIENFLGRLGLSAEGLTTPAQTNSNSSLPVHLLEIARHLGFIDLPPKQRRRLIAAMTTALADKGTVARTVYSPAERRRILKRFAVPNRTIAERYFGREALFLELPPEQDAPYFSFPDLPREALMREWVAPVIRKLLEPEA